MKKFDDIVSEILNESEELNIVITENEQIENAEDEIIKLIGRLKKEVDPDTLKKHTDGEILAMYIAPMLQGVAIRLKDANGFRKNLKKKL